MRRAWLWSIEHTLDRLTARLARTPGGPFSLVGVERMSAEDGRRACRAPERVVLRLLRCHELRLLRTAA